MKKYILTILLLAFFGMSFAQETNTSWSIIDNIVTPWETKTIVQDLGSENMIELDKIQSRFCNDDKVTKDLKVSMRPGQRKEICVAFANQSDSPINILFWFSEGTFTQEWGPVCQADTNKENGFAKYISQNELTWTTIPASGMVIQRFTYIAPKNASWDIFGCFGYQMGKQEKIKEGNMFLIVPRKVGYIYINLTWSVYNFWRRDDTKDIYTRNSSSILKGIIAILGLWIIITIIQISSKKEKINKKK